MMGLEALVTNFSRRSILIGLPILVTVAAAAAERRLARKGYDPVSYFTDGKPTRGFPEIEYEWDGLRYRFARAEHRELFKAEPVRYAPQFGNFCAMALTTATAEGDVRGKPPR